MDTITYSLKQSQPDSEMYYFSIAAFTDKILAEAKKQLQFSIGSYQSTHSKEKNFCPEEAFLELLIMGLYWKTYGAAADKLGNISGRFLTGISNLRGTQKGFKQGMDFMKGIFSTVFLYGETLEEAPVLRYDVNHLGILITWLEAAGEFKQEVKRLNKWREHLKQLPGNEAEKIIASAVSFAGWFEKQSLLQLDEYTSNVGHFLEYELQGHRWHEDVVFCGRRKIEYHLNMVGAEIMNRIYHDDFIKAAQKILLLPTCMSSPEKGKCHARVQGRGFICAGCSESCSVNGLAKLGRHKGFQVKMVPHESSIASSKTDGSLFGPGDGVIGVSCVLNLISGGWMLVEKGVSPQCVLLDYCGCRKHWHHQGIPTGINEKQLMRILGSELTGATNHA